MNWLGSFRANAPPEHVRSCLRAYYELRDSASLLRADLALTGAPLRERIAAAAVQEDIECGITSARRWLARRARRGGHGLHPTHGGAGAEPLRLAAKDGCASAPGAVPPASAVGPATAPCPSSYIITPDNPLFCARTRQELPEVNRPDNLDSNGELIA